MQDAGEAWAMASRVADAQAGACEEAEAQGELGPGLAIALALMVVGALGASAWWGILLAVLVLRCG